MFESLDYVYMPSRDVAADMAYFTDVLGAHLVFAIDGMGARVAMVGRVGAGGVGLVFRRGCRAPLALGGPEDVFGGKVVRNQLGEGGVGVLLISHLARIGVVMVRLKRSPESR